MASQMIDKTTPAIEHDPKSKDLFGCNSWGRASSPLLQIYLPRCAATARVITRRALLVGSRGCRRKSETAQICCPTARDHWVHRILRQAQQKHLGSARQCPHSIVQSLCQHDSLPHRHLSWFPNHGPIGKMRYPWLSGQATVTQGWQILQSPNLHADNRRGGTSKEITHLKGGSRVPKMKAQQFGEKLLVLKGWATLYLESFCAFWSRSACHGLWSADSLQAQVTPEACC